MEQKYQYNTVEEAIRDLQDGRRHDLCCSVCDPGKY